MNGREHTTIAIDALVDDGLETSTNVSSGDLEVEALHVVLFQSLVRMNTVLSPYIHVVDPDFGAVVAGDTCSRTCGNEGVSILGVKILLL